MFYEAVSFLNSQMSDFGTVVIGAVAFWLAYVALSLFRSPQTAGSARARRSPRVVRQFGLPPTRTGR